MMLHHICRIYGQDEVILRPTGRVLRAQALTRTKPVCIWIDSRASFSESQRGLGSSVAVVMGGSR